MKKISLRVKRHRRIRKKIVGTSARPRLSINRSLNHLYAQLVDDLNGKTLLFLSTNNKEFRKSDSRTGNVKIAQVLGEHFADLAISKGIKEIVFDKGGYLYHGRVKAFAESMRKKGLVF